MPTAHLDDKFAKSVERPSKGRVEYTDDEISGFEVRVLPGKEIIGTLRYRLLGSTDRKRFACGTFPAETMAAMRKKAEAARAMVRLGGDPNAEREAIRAERQKEALPKLDFNGLVALHLPELKKRISSWDQDKGYLARDAQPQWGERDPSKITKAECAARVLEVAQRAPVAANRFRIALKRLFGWALDQGLIDANPMDGIKKPTKERKHAVDRTLSDAELVVLWRAIEKARLASGIKAALQVLVYTGQRPNEISGLEIGELHYFDNEAERYAEIPASRMKGRKKHIWPISKPVAAIITAQIERQQQEAETEKRPMSDHVFVSRFLDRTRIARHSLSQALRRIIPEMGSEGEDGEIVKRLKADPPTPHCFRRTMITTMGRLGIPREDRKAVVAHAESDVLGEFYDGYDRFHEKKIALDKWAAHVEALISGNKKTGATVIPMRARS